MLLNEDEILERGSVLISGSGLNRYDSNDVYYQKRDPHYVGSI